MPLNILRLNQRGGQHHPNDRIVFIKALPGPTHDTALDFLSRIAAQCAPIMRQQHLSVTTLEEHEPNNEFVGRNFNAGEVVQLVLHPLRRSGNNQGERWLPFRYVQMVMMHELAHCQQMNHSRAFWAVRNTYAGLMRELWGKNYTGDGLWGRGQTLYSGQHTDTQQPDASELPEHLCGGAYRSRGRKRKRKTEKLSYAERKQKWIEKKFGTEGQALGEDEMKRMMLEKGKLNVSKPRVAGSKRGRDLRAEAAAQRFRREENLKNAEKEAEEAIKREDEEEEDDSTTEDEFGDLDDALDDNGRRLLDSQGRGMVRVCGDEDVEQDENVKNEMFELSQIGHNQTNEKSSGETVVEDDVPTDEDDGEVEDDPVDSAPPEFSRPSKPHQSVSGIPTPRSPATNRKKGEAIDSTSTEVIGHEGKDTLITKSEKISDGGKAASDERERHAANASEVESHHRCVIDLSPSPSSTTYNQNAGDTAQGNSTLKLRLPPNQICPVCSLENEPTALTCIACSHVLDTTRLSRHWFCPSTTCKSKGYANSDDVGRCGLCGTPKPVPV